MQTQKSTIVALMNELIETHIEKCSWPAHHADEVVPQVISEEFGTKANIIKIGNAGDTIRIDLDDGTFFCLQVI